MEKVKNEIKIPAIIALAVQGAVVFAELLIICLQEKLLPLYFGGSDIAKGVKVFTPAIILSTLVLGIYIAFVSVIFNYSGNHRRPVSIVLMALELGIMGLSYPINTIYSHIIGRISGTSYLAAFSAVNSMLGLGSALFGFVAAPMFFIACGRYGISKREDQ